MSDTLEAMMPQCTLTGEFIPPIPRPETTFYRGLTRRYRGLTCPACQIAVSLGYDQGNRSCPECGGMLVILREADVAGLKKPQTAERALAQLSPEMQQVLMQLWRCDDKAQTDALVDKVPAGNWGKIAQAVDFAALPANPAAPRGFSHNGKDERLSRMLEAGLRLLASRPADPGTAQYWDALIKAMRRRVLSPRDPRAPLDDAKDPFYLIGNVRQMLVQAGNQLLRQKRAKDAVLCFHVVLSANPELSEVQYAQAVAANNVVAQPNATRLDRVTALRAFNAFLRSASAQQDPKRLATVHYLRRQIMGMKDNPKPQ